MTLWNCKCLNVSLESDTAEKIENVKKLELSPIEQRDHFFNEKLVLCPGNSLKMRIAQPALVEHQGVGRWVLHSCLACGQQTHALSQDNNNFVLIRKDLENTVNQVNALKKSSNFSPVFNLLIPEVTNDIEMKENIDTNNMKIELKMMPTAQVIGSLSKQLSQTLQSQLEAVEETVRQFRDQKYAEFEAYRERAQNDHKILASIVNKTRGRQDSGWKNNDNGPLSPQLPPAQRRRLSSIKDAKKINQHISKSQSNKNFPPEEDSLDAEDIFDLEGTDSNLSRNDYISDQDDYDDDNSGSNDEGIHIARGRGGRPAKNEAAFEIARSLPIGMPNAGHERQEKHDLEDEEEPQDIAASIKALARSVHGDVYELPRPRFSTQI